MEYVPCPACGAFNDGPAKVCAACKAPLDAEPAAAPALTLKSEPEAAPVAATPEVPAPTAPEAPAFAPPPDVKAKIDALEAQIAAKPEARALYLQLANVYAESGRADLAAAVVKRAIDREPANAYLRHKLAQISGTPEPRVKLSAPSPGAAVVGVAVRPSAPAWRKRIDSRRVRLGAAAALFVLLALGAKAWLFPGTRLLVAGDFMATSPVFSPTGRHLAFLLDDASGSRLAVYDMKKGDYAVVGPCSAWDGHGFSWSPDGTRIVYAGGGEDDGNGSLYVYTLASGQSQRLAPGRSPAWRNGGTILAVCSPEPAAESVYVGDDEYSADSESPAGDWRQRFCRIDAATGSVTRAALAAEYGMAPSPLLDMVLFEQWSDSGTEDAGGGEAISPDKAAQDLADLAIAGDSRNLAQASSNLGRELEARQHMEKRRAARAIERLPAEVELYVADVDRAEPMRLAGAGEAGFASWTPGGDRILFAANAAGGIEYWTMKPDGTDRQPILQGVKADPSSVTLSADGKLVFFVASVSGGSASTQMTGESAADLHVVEVGKGGPKRIANRHSYKQRYAVSPDARQIVYEVRQDVNMLGGAGRSELWLVKR